MESRSTQTPKISAAGVISLAQRHLKSLAGDDKKDKFALTRANDEIIIKSHA